MNDGDINSNMETSMGVSFGAKMPDESNPRISELSSLRSTTVTQSNGFQAKPMGQVVSASGNRLKAYEIIGDKHYTTVDNVSERIKAKADLVFTMLTDDGKEAVSAKDIEKLKGRTSLASDGTMISPPEFRAMTKEEESELVDLFNRIMAEGNHMELVANDKEEGTEKKVEKRDLRGKVTDNRDQVNQDNKTYFAQRMILNGIMANLKSMFAKVEKRKSEDKAKRQEEHEKVMDKIVEKAQQHFKEATRTNEKEQNNDKRASEANVAKIRGDITHTTSRPEVIRNDVTPPKS
jgi:hypothetical protein